ncbi:hypothetical protein [Streptomyces sp. NPDC050264]|uniref:hypothetical protein n=1 Tax=Streptomyces sp. NPDC050264 TaxID=3155038 RepID=UPI00342DDB4A
MSSKLDLDVARRVCEVAAGGSLSTDSSVVEVRARGVQTVLAVRLNTAEVERRQREGMAPLLDIAVLDGLMQLPAGLPVPASSLSPLERKLLRQCPAGAVQWRDGTLVRQAVRPLRVDAAVVRSLRPTMSCLRRAGRFGAYAATSVWLNGSAKDVELLVMEAAVYGIGVVRGRADEAPDLLVAPRGLPQPRHTAAGWLLAEQVFSELAGPDRVPESTR